MSMFSFPKSYSFHNNQKEIIKGIYIGKSQMASLQRRVSFTEYMSIQTSFGQFIQVQ